MAPGRKALLPLIREGLDQKCSCSMVVDLIAKIPLQLRKYRRCDDACQYY
jgi:hypothetical protein